MTAAEQQSEELEVLRSIFDGDAAFTIQSNNIIQYRFGDEGDFRSFLLEFRWPPLYPDELPEFNLDLFYNKHLTADTKSSITNCLREEAQSLLGSPMTYSLIEIVKDRLEQLMENQVAVPIDADTKIDRDSDSDEVEKRSTAVKQDKLTKAQKRKQWDRGQANDEKPRGWNWIDVVKHLSQTGGQS